MEIKVLKRGIFKRIFGICATQSPADEGCWSFSKGKVEIDLSRAPELSQPWGAIRLEKKNLPERILVIKDGEGAFHAFRNKCTHMGRRLDPVPDASTVQCCSVGKSTFDYDGNVVKAAKKDSIRVYAVKAENGRLTVEL